MKTSLIYLLLLSPFSFTPVNLGFPSFLEQEIDIALQFLKSKQANIAEASTSWNSPTEEVLAIASPELIRHQLFRDFFETQALEVAYVNFGKNVADFSIGYFQMKPSFVEQLEDYLSQNPISSVSLPSSKTFPQQSKKAERQIRLQRLKDFQWQLQYAHAFYQVVLNRFPELCDWAPQERIAFAASAYNFGFEESATDINAWRCTEAFPYGKKYEGPQATYADLAVSFYEKLMVQTSR